MLIKWHISSVTLTLNENLQYDVIVPLQFDVCIGEMKSLPMKLSQRTHIDLSHTEYHMLHNIFY